MKHQSSLGVPGNTLKAIGQTAAELRVGNYIVLFGGRDLTGEFFTKSTQFDSSYTDIGLLYVDFEHGRDHERMGNSADNVLGVVDWKSARTDERGIFVERVLNRRAGYVQYLLELMEAGILGTSSEAVHEQTQKSPGGEILRWPLRRDSLTVTPMEPRMIGGNVVTAAKSLFEFFPHSKSLAALSGAPAPSRPRNDALAGCGDVRELERLLRDTLSLSARKARGAANALWPILNERDAREDDRDDHQAEPAQLKALADRLQSITSLLSPRSHQ